MENRSVFQFSKFMEDFTYMGLANMLIFVATLVQAIIIPKLLNINDFGYWRIFILYITFSGLLHLGFVDGIYILWARKECNQFASDISTALKILMLQMFVVALIITTVLFFISNNIILLFYVVIYAFIYNIFTFFQCINQILKKYKIVSVTNIIFSVVFVVSLMILIIFGQIRYYLVICAYIFALFITTMILFLLSNNIKKNVSSETYTQAFNYKQYILAGLPLLVANLISLFLINADLVIISNFFSINQFAYYAFAGMLLSVILLLTRALSAVFFPHFSTMTDDDKKKYYAKTLNAIILIGGFLMGFYPLIILIIKHFLQKYMISIVYLKVLMLTPMLLMCIQVVHLNYYQLFLKQKKYLLVVLALTILSILLFYVVGKITHNLIYFAATKVIIFVVWYLANELVLRKTIGQNLMDIIKRCFIIIFTITIFVVCLFIDRTLLNILVYYISFFIMVIIIFNSQSIKVKNMIMHSLSTHKR